MTFDLDRGGGRLPPPLEAFAGVPGLAGVIDACEHLSEQAAALGLAAARSAVLTELSFRLYDPGLRELAARTLAAQVQAMRLLHDRLAALVVEQLDAAGMPCRCICPMCGIGACGCTVVARARIAEAWSHRFEPDEPGLTLTAPRPGSPLHENGVRAGERLVAIDGRPIAGRGLDAVVEIQAAIRRHRIGDTFAVTIVGADGSGRGVSVTHVTDMTD